MNNVKVDVKNEIAYVTIDRPKALICLKKCHKLQLQL